MDSGKDLSEQYQQYQLDMQNMILSELQYIQIIGPAIECNSHARCQV